MINQQVCVRGQLSRWQSRLHDNGKIKYAQVGALTHFCKLDLRSARVYNSFMTKCTDDLHDD